MGPNESPLPMRFRKLLEYYCADSLSAISAFSAVKLCQIKVGRGCGLSHRRAAVYANDGAADASSPVVPLLALGAVHRAKRAVDFDEHLALAVGQMWIAVDLADGIGFVDTARIDDSGLQLECFGRQP